MENYFNYLNEGEDEITLKNAKRVIIELCENSNELKKNLQKESDIKNSMMAFILSKGLLDEYNHFNSKTPMKFEQAAKVLAYSLE